MHAIKICFFFVTTISVPADCLFNLTLNNSGTPVPLVIPEGVQSPLTCRWSLTVPENHTIRVSADQSSLRSSRLMVSEGHSLFGSKTQAILGEPETGMKGRSIEKYYPRNSLTMQGCF